MRWKPHVRFGGRAEESEQPKGRNRASARSNHTHGSLLIKEGIPVKVVSERLGHARIAHTIQTYQHLLPGMQAAAADVTEQLAQPRPAPDMKEKSSPVERRGNSRRNAA